MSGKRIWKENRKKHGTDRKKRAAVGVLLFCLFAGCGEKGKIQEIPTVAPDRQAENAAQAGGTDGTSQDRAKKPTSEAQPDSTGGLSGKPQPGGITAPAASFDPATTTAKDPSLPPNPSGDFLIMQDTLVRYNGTADTVVVPENVTTIGAAAFRGNTALVHLVLPEGVGTIEEDAFGNCRSLVEASLPKSLESVGNRAFAGCSALREINLQIPCLTGGAVPAIS